MQHIPIDRIENDLSSYLQMAEKEDVIITRQGVPIGILIGLDDAEDWWEELLLHNPKFLARIAQARENLREGKSTSIEQLRAKYST
ncbi:type II toxin-antitoxin system prevent-host-death family antitoxin [Lusitaniella coriacea]|uniref:type II toxin-antitoxin system prevent-host-death family antitoxin n=1 Tax=Lusitaniella coriacea TaxID=1983105 RepID=UPI003CF09153